MLFLKAVYIEMGAARKTYKVKKYRKNKRTTRKNMKGGNLKFNFEASNILKKYILLLNYDFKNSYYNIIGDIYKEWNKHHKTPSNQFDFPPVYKYGERTYCNYNIKKKILSKATKEIINDGIEYHITSNEYEQTNIKEIQHGKKISEIDFFTTDKGTKISIIIDGNEIEDDIKNLIPEDETSSEHYYDIMVNQRDNYLTGKKQFPYGKCNESLYKGEVRVNPLFIDVPETSTPEPLTALTGPHTEEEEKEKGKFGFEGGKRRNKRSKHKRKTYKRSKYKRSKYKRSKYKR